MPDWSVNQLKTALPSGEFTVVAVDTTELPEDRWATRFVVLEGAFTGAIFDLFLSNRRPENEEWMLVATTSRTPVGLLGVVCKANIDRTAEGDHNLNVPLSPLVLPDIIIVRGREYKLQAVRP